MDEAHSNIGTVRDIMVPASDVVAIASDDTLDVISGLFEKYDYDGMPVVDASQKVLGIITAYDMVVQSSGMHLPTVLNIMDDIAKNKADRRQLDEHFGKLREIKAIQVMNPTPLTINASASVTQLAELFAENRKVNPVIVVNDDGTLAGVVSRYDVIKFFNAAYFSKVVQKVNPGTDPFKEFPTRSRKEVEEAVSQVKEEFLLVQKRRPLIWKYIAIAAFAAGLVAATALIIRIVQKQ